jgi:URI fold toxin 2
LFYVFGGNQVVHSRELEGLEPEEDLNQTPAGFEGGTVSEADMQSGTPMGGTLQDVVVTNSSSGSKYTNTGNYTNCGYSGKESLSNGVTNRFENYYGSGAYGWNDGSAEKFWEEDAPVISSIFTFINGIQSKSISKTLFGVLLCGIDAVSFGEGSVGIKATETYALKAVESGFYPVMTRGFKSATELIYLEKGEVWKYGVTKNPLTRYAQKFLDNLGEHGVYYDKIFSGARAEALQIEQMGILNYLEKSGVLPAGNKVKF